MAIKSNLDKNTPKAERTSKQQHSGDKNEISRVSCSASKDGSGAGVSTNGQCTWFLGKVSFINFINFEC